MVQSDTKKPCKTCLWWINWAGKSGDFGWFAPCVCDESPHRMKVTRIDTTCPHWRERKSPVGTERQELEDLGYNRLDAPR